MALILRASTRSVRIARAILRAPLAYNRLKGVTEDSGLQKLLVIITKIVIACTDGESIHVAEVGS